MEKSHQDILKQLRKAIVDDVDVYNGIIRPLQVDSIITEEDVKNIKTQASKKDRAVMLLDILPGRGPYAFGIFHQALRHHYGWLSDKMDLLLESNGMAVNDMGCCSGSLNLQLLSPLTVTREEKMGQLKSAFEKLEPGEYIVLHGMKGFGKSCLTASTLRDKKLVKNLFSNHVYWIKFGYERTFDEEMLIQLNTLYYLVKNIEMPEALNPEPLKDSLLSFLKTQFSKESHRNALLILDDVCNKKIIDVFDFECKTLVITADTDVLDNRRATIIEMNDGFTEAETLGLFAKSLGSDVSKLPHEAKRIHDECKGMPLLIAMLSAQFEEFKDDMNIRSERWKYYLRCLRMKDTANRVMEMFFEKQNAIFDMCIGQLRPELRKRYEDLAIFSEDVNIMPATLEILWDGHPFQVEEMMLDLCHKSLAAKQWNQGLQSYIYGVHDLLLCHLRKKLTPKKLKEMHRCFVEKYREFCKGDFSKLPKDNYTYSYIGHHLEEAEMYDEFPKLYFDFNFLQAKIAQTGLSNLLIDLKKYRRYITSNNNSESEKKVRDIERFLEEQARILAEHRRKNCLDIVQIAMNHSHPGYVMETAKKLAEARSKTLYLSHHKKIEYNEVPLSEEVSTDISTSSFTDDPNLILVGNDQGEVILWDCENRQQKVFHGHTPRSIKKIVVSGGGDCFLSLSDCGTIKLFTLNEEECSDLSSHIQSPRQKQTWWRGIFSNKVFQDDSLATFAINNEVILDMAFAHDDVTIAACTDRGTIAVWDRRGNTLFRHNHKPDTSCLRSVVFTAKSQLLHIMDETHGVLIIYQKCGNEYIYLTQFNPQTNSKKIIFFRIIPYQDNSLIIVTEKKAIYVKWFCTNNDQIHSFSKQVRANVEDEKSVYVAAAMTYDGRYLVLADSAGFMNIWDIMVIIHDPVKTYKYRITSLDTYWFKEEGYHIICGSENRLVHKWMLPVEELPTSVRKPVFDALVQPFDKADIVAKETFSNTVVTLHGENTIAESDPINEKIVCLCLSPDGKKIVFMTENGSLTLFDLEEQKMTPILKLAQATDFVKFLNIEGNDVIICRDVNHTLRVWQNFDMTFIVENTGHIIFVDAISDKCVVSITLNGIITFWSIKDSQWLCANRCSIDDRQVSLSHTALSSSKNLIAVLRENRELMLFNLTQDATMSPVHTSVETCFTCFFDRKLTACNISQNDQYLAIGLENGHISVFEIPSGAETCRFLFHDSEITQLYWAPSVVDMPLLLSVNGDELVWWNVALANCNGKQKRRSRMGFARSNSNPCIGTSAMSSVMHMPSSHSADLNMCNTQYVIPGAPKDGNVLTNGSHKLSLYWKSKESKDPRWPGLLAIVRLPSSCNGKVCISADFSKFLTVDIHGSISTFKLFGYT